MSKFRAAPQLPSEDAFIKGAEGPRTTPLRAVKKASVDSEAGTEPVAAPVVAKAAPLVNSFAVAVDSSEPWSAHDPNAKRIESTQPLRLNAYQYEQLKWLAESEDRSLAQILRRLIGPALEEAVRAERE